MEADSLGENPLDSDGVGLAGTFKGEAGGAIGHRLYATSIALIALTVIIVTARLYVRVRMLRIVGSDDYMIIVALLLAFGVIVMNFMSVEAGLGQHIWNLDPSALSQILKSMYVSQLFYISSLVFTKISLLLQLIRLAPHSRLRTIFWSILAFTAAVGVASIIASIILCSPPSYLWERFDPTKSKDSGKCVSYEALAYSVPALNAGTDCIVWMAPMMLFRMVQLPFRQKIGLMAVFAVGILVPISAVARIIIVSKTVAEDAQADPPYTLLRMKLWSTVETTIAIICSSIPSLRPLIKQVGLGRLLGSSFGGTGAPISTNNPGRSGGSKGIHLSVLPTHSSSTEQFAGTGGYAADIESAHGGTGSSEDGMRRGIMVRTEATVSYSSHGAN